MVNLKREFKFVLEMKNGYGSRAKFILGKSGRLGNRSGFRAVTKHQEAQGIGWGSAVGLGLLKYLSILKDDNR